MADESVQQENAAKNVNTEAADSGKRDSYRRSSNQQNTRQQSSGGRSFSNRGGSDYRRTGRYQPRRKVCAFCVDKTKSINWKDVEGLRRFVTENGNMRARRKTGTCAKHQRRLAVAIKRARFIALLPYTTEHVRLTARR